MPKTIEFDSEVSDQIVALRDVDEYKWDAIGEAMEMAVGKAMLIYSFAKVPKKDRIKDATDKDIQRLRDVEILSWGDIMARTHLGEATVRSMYKEATGKDSKGNRIGKGGRYPNGTKAPEKVAAKVTKTTKKATGKSTPRMDPQTQPLAGLDLDQIKEKITGYAVKIRMDNGNEEVVRVKAVKKLGKGTLVVSDDTGAGRTLKLAAVFQVSRKKFAV